MTPFGPAGFGGDGSCTSADDLASAACKLHESAAEWGSAQAKGYATLSAAFDASQQRRALVDLLCAKAMSFRAARESDAVMAVLQDSRSRATEFMSRYIEVKDALHAATAPPSSPTGVEA